MIEFESRGNNAKRSFQNQDRDIFKQTSLDEANSHPKSNADRLQALHARGAKLSLQELTALKKIMGQTHYHKHDDLLRSLKGRTINKFQIFAFLNCLVAFSTEAFLIYNLSFLNLMPQFKCLDTETKELYKC